MGILNPRARPLLDGFPMWKYLVEDGSRMGEATVLALSIAAAIVAIGSALALVGALRRSRSFTALFQRRRHVEPPIGANRDSI